MLDFDATDDLVHGEQEGRHFSAYYDNYCFLPLYVFCGEQRRWSLPASSQQTGAACCSDLETLALLRQARPGVAHLRGDSGFCRPLMSW